MATLDHFANLALNSASNSLPSVTRLHVDGVRWTDFAREWRHSYYEFTSAQAKSPSPQFKTIDEHHYDSLKQLLDAHQITPLWSEEELREICQAWHELEPWYDTKAGLTALNALGIQTCTLSNGNVSLLKDLCAHSSLPFTQVFSAELFRAYKPSPQVYKGAFERLGFKPEETMMVAAHLGDLKAASQCGMRTCYVVRHKEEAWDEDTVSRAKEEGWVEIWVGLDDTRPEVGGFVEVARRLGADDSLQTNDASLRPGGAL